MTLRAESRPPVVHHALREHSGQQLLEQLAAVAPGGPVMVHSSLRRVGPVSGGADTVLRALLDTVGPTGTVVVPTFTSENSDTSPPYLDRVRGLDPAQVEAVRAAMPAFDAATTRAPRMGTLAETLRQAPGARRSAHPQTSFAALGHDAGELVADHHLDCHLGEDSPLARLYERNAQVLLLGVGFDVLTAFHLAEYRVAEPPRRRYRCVVRPEGADRTWWEYEDVLLDDGDFEKLGDAFERDTDAVSVIPFGSGTARLLRLRDAVDYAVEWLPAHRSA